MKGDMRMLEVMPSDALAAGATIVGTGATPEGIDQNPAYYEYTFDTAWHATAQPLDGWFARYASRRYGNTANADAAAAWKILSTAVSTITCKPAASSCLAELRCHAERCCVPGVQLTSGRMARQHGRGVERSQRPTDGGDGGRARQRRLRPKAMRGPDKRHGRL